jgi:hypothetical protein
LNQILYLNDKKISLIRKEIILEKLEQDVLEKLKQDSISKIESTSLNTYEKVFKVEQERRKSIISKYDYTRYFKNISYTKNNIFLEN